MNERDFFEERDNRPAYSDSEGVELVPVSPGPLITPAEDWHGQSADYTYPSVYQEAPPDGADVAGAGMSLDDDALWASLIETEGRQNEQEGLLADAYVNGAGMDDESLQTFYGVTREELAAYREGLSPEAGAAADEEREGAIQHRQREAAYHVGVQTGLEASAPELLEGRLPAAQEALLGDAPYILGSNQSSLGGVEEAAQYLVDHGGVNITDYTLKQRFLFWDANHTDGYVDRALVRGYWGESGGGKLIVAIPHQGTDYEVESLETLPDSYLWNGELPEDFYISQGSLGIVNVKYVAGFTAHDGTYHPNNNFMLHSTQGLANLEEAT